MPGASRRSRRRTPRGRPPGLLFRVRSAPTLVAAGVLMLAAGALPGSSSTQPRLTTEALSWPGAHASATGGVSRVVPSGVLDRGGSAVSRDSQRQALADAAHEPPRAASERAGKQTNAALAALAARAEKQAGRLAMDAWQLPVTAGAYQLTSRFGQCSALWAHCHTGLDFAAPTGTPIHAVATGTITGVGWAGAYGNRTIMTLPDGSELWYCHQSAYAVTVGQRVLAGQVIGAVGATGNTTGPHVHLEVRPGAGDPVDPFAALVAHGLHP